MHSGFFSVSCVSSCDVGQTCKPIYPFYQLSVRRACLSYGRSDNPRSAGGPGREEEQFGQERLAKVMEENRYRGAQEIIDAVRQAIADFVGDQPQFDDITLIVLKSARDGKQV